MTEKMKNALPGGLAFPLFGVYLEWLLFFADGAGIPSALVLFRLALAGAAFGAFLWLLSRWLPNKKAARWVTGIGWFLAGVLVIANHCCHVFFGTYFQLSFMLSMSTQVAGGFFRETMTTILHNLWFFPLGFLPMILTIAFRKKLLPEGRDGGFVSIGVFALLTFCAVLLCHTGADGRYYTYAYSASDATPPVRPGEFPAAGRAVCPFRPACQKARRYGADRPRNIAHQRPRVAGRIHRRHGGPGGDGAHRLRQKRHEY